MYQRISPIQKRQPPLMVVHKPMLHVVLSDGEYPREHRLLLKPQYPHTILLRNFPDLVRMEYRFADDFGHAVKEIGYYPIEHLNQKWEFLQQSAVQMVGEPRRIRRAQLQPTP